MKTRIILCVVLLVFALSLLAEVPQLINYQGKILDDNGLPINGVLNISFKIYDTEVNGTVLWNETQNVTVIEGVFNVLLGSVETFSNTLFNDAERYLAIQIEGEIEIADRSRLVSTPYTINAQKLNGKDDEEVLYPYNIRFMTTPIHYKTFILTQANEWYLYYWQDDTWSLRTSPPISADDIIFMDSYDNYVYILTKNNEFYRYYESSDTWTQYQSPPVAP